MGNLNFALEQWELIAFCLELLLFSTPAQPTRERQCEKTNSLIDREGVDLIGSRAEKNPMSSQ